MCYRKSSYVTAVFIGSSGDGALGFSERLFFWNRPVVVEKIAESSAIMFCEYSRQAKARNAT